MKCLLLPLLLAPGIAMAGLVIVADAPITLAQAAQPAKPLVLPPRFPAAVPVQAPAMRVVELEQWEIKAGSSLRSTLETWCDRAGYRLLWNVDGGFRSQGGLVSEGDFKKAVAELFAAVPQDLHLHVELTKNKLVIVTRGEK